MKRHFVTAIILAIFWGVTIFATIEFNIGYFVLATAIIHLFATLMPFYPSMVKGSLGEKSYLLYKESLIKLRQEIHYKIYFVVFNTALFTAAVAIFVMVNVSLIDMIGK